jgi:flavin-dependent dehydrogenase
VETDAGIFQAQLVVGADGSNGVTRRCVLPNAPVHTARLLEVLTPTQPSLKSFEFGGGREGAYFDFFPVPSGIAGYTWDFPTQVNGQPMRCWGIYDTNILSDMQRPALKEPLAEEMARHGFDFDDVELKGHPIRWFSPRAEMSAPRVLLAGDAVGADPIFGEGISMALGYGAVAAREIGEAFRRNDFSFNGYRRRVLRSALGRTLTARWVIAQILYRVRWRLPQKFFWRRMGWIIVAAAWVFVLNWGKRLKP